MKEKETFDVGKAKELSDRFMVVRQSGRLAEKGSPLVVFEAGGTINSRGRKQGGIKYSRIS